jgi:hypothetical protein
MQDLTNITGPCVCVCVCVCVYTYDEVANIIIEGLGW